jgi:hypothetical protein
MLRPRFIRRLEGKWAGAAVRQPRPWQSSLLAARERNYVPRRRAILGIVVAATGLQVVNALLELLNPFFQFAEHPADLLNGGHDAPAFGRLAFEASSRIKYTIAACRRDGSFRNARMMAAYRSGTGVRLR